MDTAVILTRLQKRDGYLQSSRQLARISLDEYLADDNIQAIVKLVYAHLTERLDDFEQFAREILKQISL